MNLQALERFAAAFPEPILLVSSEGLVHGANAAAVRAYQLPRPLPAGLALSRLVNNAANDLLSYLRRCARSRQPVPGRLRLKATQLSAEALRIDGSVVSPAAAGEPAIIMLRGRAQALDGSGFAILKHQVDALNKEIAARKRAQADLFAQQEWLRVTLDSIGDAVIATDPQGRVVFMNPVAERLTGWTQTQAMGRPLEEIFRIVHEETGDVVENPCQKAIRTGRVTTLANHTALIDRSGRLRPIEDSAAPIRDEAERLFGVVLVFHDVTERRHAEQQLKALNETLEQRVFERTAEAGLRTADLHASEERLSMAIEASEAGYYEHSIPLETGYVSRRWARLLGYQLDELPPKPELRHWWESRLHEEDRQRVTRAYRDFMAGHRDHQDIEYRIKHRNGEWRWQRLVSRAVQREPTGRARVAAGLVFDITAQKQAERKLQKLNAALEMRAIQLRALAAQLTHAEQSERRRLAQILHDHLQQILVAARLNLSALRNGAEEPVLHQSLSAIEELIHEAIEASSSLTVELSPPALYEGRLSAALQWLAQWMEERHGLRVDVRTNCPVDEIREDEISEHIRVLLFQAIRELLFNVVKHAGVDQAFIRLEQQSGCIVLEVMDQGVGFATEAAIHGRLDRFGLFSIRERMDACGGQLEIDSATGQGTRIRLSAPLQPPAGEPREPASECVTLASRIAARKPAAAPEPSKIRVLLADADASARHGLRRLLCKQPDMTIVAEAANGILAVEMARQLHPDVVIMDISSMSLLSGVDTIRFITRELSTVRIVAFSMHMAETTANAAREAGAVACLRKGDDLDDLIAAIRSDRTMAARGAQGTDLSSVIGRANGSL